MKIFRRLIEVLVAGGEARALLEDDYHRFRLRLTHDGAKVTAIQGESFRHPWDLCTFAPRELDALVGAPLEARMSSANHAANPRAQCTHLFDMAALTMGLIARGVSQRRYLAEAPWPGQEPMTAKLYRDDALLLAWDIGVEEILGPEPYGPRSVHGGFTGFAASLSPEDEEAALVLRRTLVISRGRGLAYDDETLTSPTGGFCYVQNPERGPKAGRSFSTRVDFSGCRQELGVVDRAWIREIDPTSDLARLPPSS